MTVVGWLGPSPDGAGVPTVDEERLRRGGLKGRLGEGLPKQKSRHTQTHGGVRGVGALLKTGTGGSRQGGATEDQGAPPSWEGASLDLKL